MLEAGFIREVFHPEWLANPIIIPKANGKLGMCMDYSDLKKACPKDPFPLPHIDQVVDSMARCDFLCFLDAYSRYHHISMAEEVWQNRLNYSGSSVLVVTRQATEAQRTSNGTTHWSVGSPSDSTTVTQDRCRFTSHEDESSLTTAHNFYTIG
jgi:hypothetical protein